MQPGISANRGPEYYEPVYKQGNTLTDKLYNAVEDYFYLDGLSKGRKFTVISTKADGKVEVKVEARNKTTYTGWALTALKLLSWVTVVVPVGMWIAHKMHTPKNKSQFKVIDPSAFPNFPRPTPSSTTTRTVPDSNLTQAGPHLRPQAPAEFQRGKQTFVELQETKDSKMLTERLKNEGAGCCIILESRTFLGDYSLEIANLPKTRLLAKVGQGFYYFGTDTMCQNLTDLLDSLKISKVLIPKSLKEKLEACNVVPGSKVPLPESMGGVKIDTSKITSTTTHDEAIKELDALNKGCLIEKANDVIPGRPLYRFTYDDGEKRVSHIVEFIKEKNPQNPNQIPGHIPGQLHFYTLDEANKLNPIGESYGNLQSFLRLCNIRSKGECRCLVASDVLEEFIKASKELRAKEGKTAQREAPVLKSTEQGDIYCFIEDYLEPFIRGEITPEEAKGRRPMLELLTEQYKAKLGGKELTEADRSHLKYIAFAQYTRRLIEGYYIMLADQDPKFDPKTNFDAKSTKFEKFLEAYCEAAAFDFKGQFSDKTLQKTAADSLETVNTHRTEAFARVEAETAARLAQSGGKQATG